MKGESVGIAVVSLRPGLFSLTKENMCIFALVNVVSFKG